MHARRLYCLRCARIIHKLQEHRPVLLFAARSAAAHQVSSYFLCHLSYLLLLLEVVILSPSLSCICMFLIFFLLISWELRAPTAVHDIDKSTDVIICEDYFVYCTSYKCARYQCISRGGVSTHPSIHTYMHALCIGHQTGQSDSPT